MNDQQGMNDDQAMNDPQEPLSDERIADLLASLRAVCPPDEAHATNLAAVRRALSDHARPSWWRRGVTVPIPVAIAAGVALACTTGALMWPASEPQRIGPESNRQTQATFTPAGADSESDADYQARPAWSVSRSYLQSIESLAMSRGALITDLSEKHDES